MNYNIFYWNDKIFIKDIMSTQKIDDLIFEIDSLIDNVKQGVNSKQIIDKDALVQAEQEKNELKEQIAVSKSFIKELYLDIVKLRKSLQEEG